MSNKTYSSLTNPELLELYLSVRELLYGEPLNNVHNLDHDLFSSLANLLEKALWLMKKEINIRLPSYNHENLEEMPEFWVKKAIALTPKGIST